MEGAAPSAPPERSEPPHSPKTRTVISSVSSDRFSLPSSVVAVALRATVPPHPRSQTYRPPHDCPRNSLACPVRPYLPLRPSSVLRAKLFPPPRSKTPFGNAPAVRRTVRATPLPHPANALARAWCGHNFGGFAVTSRCLRESYSHMKLFSLPVLLAGAAIVIVGGGIIFAMNSATHKPVVVASQPSAPDNTSGASASTDNTAPAPVATTDSNATPPPPAQANPGGWPGGNGGNGWNGGGGPNGGQRGGGGQRMQQMFAQLGLSPDQQQQIDTIRANTSLSRQDRRAAIMKVLTPDQQAKYQQLRAQMRAQRGNGQGGGGPGGQGGGGQGGGGGQPRNGA